MSFAALEVIAPSQTRERLAGALRTLAPERSC